jgi:hypothetical protein
MRVGGWLLSLNRSLSMEEWNNEEEKAQEYDLAREIFRSVQSMT